MRSGVMLAVMIVLAQCVEAQRGPMGGPEERPRFLLSEAVNLMSPDSSKSRVDIHYRIDQQFFVQVRNPDPSFPWRYRRRGEILIELDDSTGVSRARTIDEAILGSATSDDSPDLKEWYQGLASFTVRPGLYTIVLELTDLESDRHFLERSRTVRAIDFHEATQETSSPLFIVDSGATLIPERLTPTNFGGDILFGSSDALFLEMGPTAQAESTVVIEYAFSERNPGSDEARQASLRDRVSARIIPSVDLVPVKGENTVSYSVSRNTGTRASGIYIPLHTELLPLRSYIFTATVGEGARALRIKRPVQMIWPDMPRSLRNVDYAIDALRFITTDAQRDSLKEGNFETKRDNLEAFWKRRDPNPTTAYNELMTQYYRRVDYAAGKFGTLHDPDGSRTDRGRVYILNGPPSSTERALDPTSGFKEVWVYDRLNRTFTFVDATRSGNYVLVATTP